MKLIENNKRYEISRLWKEYAESNNPYKIGDIINDHSGYGRIESIQVNKAFGNEYPECVYWCEELTVKYLPKKNPSKRNIWQSNIKKS